MTLITNTITTYHVKCDAANGACQNRTEDAPSAGMACKIAAADGFMRASLTELYYCQNHCKSAADSGIVLTHP